MKETGGDGQPMQTNRLRNEATTGTASAEAAASTSSTMVPINSPGTAKTGSFSSSSSGRPNQAGRQAGTLISVNGIRGQTAFLLQARHQSNNNAAFESDYFPVYLNREWKLMAGLFKQQRELLERR